MYNNILKLNEILKYTNTKKRQILLQIILTRLSIKSCHTDPIKELLHDSTLPKRQTEYLSKSHRKGHVEYCSS